ncbi:MULTISPECIES: hypothetical protein [Alphaproteobacteria]|uniref:hypothetical protein n=1 Tax=Alphaproteobacteria TaxID=28211 RepID=UPI003265969B
MRKQRILIATIIWFGTVIAALFAKDYNAAALDDSAVVETAENLMPRPIAIRVKPAPAELYTRIAKTVSTITRKVQVTPTTAGLRITADDGAAYEEWMLALTSSIAQAPNMRWDMANMCAGVKCPGRTLSATINAAQIQTEVTR